MNIKLFYTPKECEYIMCNIQYTSRDISNALGADVNIKKTVCTMFDKLRNFKVL
jgi:hypothetical protein